MTNEKYLSARELHSKIGNAEFYLEKLKHIDTQKTWLGTEVLIPENLVEKIVELIRDEYRKELIEARRKFDEL